MLFNFITLIFKRDYYTHHLIIVSNSALVAVKESQYFIHLLRLYFLGILSTPNNFLLEKDFMKKLINYQ